MKSDWGYPPRTGYTKAYGDRWSGAFGCKRCGGSGKTLVPRDEAATLGVPAAFNLIDAACPECCAEHYGRPLFSVEPCRCRWCSRVGAP